MALSQVSAWRHSQARSAVAAGPATASSPRDPTIRLAHTGAAPASRRVSSSSRATSPVRARMRRTSSMVRPHRSQAEAVNASRQHAPQAARLRLGRAVGEVLADAYPAVRPALSPVMCSAAVLSVSARAARSAEVACSRDADTAGPEPVAQGVPRPVLPGEGGADAAHVLVEEVFRVAGARVEQSGRRSGRRRRSTGG